MLRLIVQGALHIFIDGPDNESTAIKILQIVQKANYQHINISVGTHDCKKILRK